MEDFILNMSTYEFTMANYSSENVMRKVKKYYLSSHLFFIIKRTDTDH